MADCGSKNVSWFEKNTKKTLLFILSFFLILTAFGAETYLASKQPAFSRKIWDDPDYGRYIRLREFEPLPASFYTPTIEYVSVRDGLQQKSVIFRTDKDGFIMPSGFFEKPGLTIAFLGGSTTECFYVDEGNRFPFLTGKLIGEKLGKRVNSYNAGRGGNNSMHSINILINKILPLKPKFVMISHSVSDLLVLTFERTYWNNNPASSLLGKGYNNKKIYSFKEWILNIKTVFFPNITSAIEKIVAKKSAEEAAEKHDESELLSAKEAGYEFKSALQLFINICRAKEITPVLLTEASRLDSKPNEYVWKHIRFMTKDKVDYSKIYETSLLFEEIVREVGRENNVTVIDLAAEIPKTNEYIYDAYHFNDTGSKLASEIISKRLLELMKDSKE